MRNIRRRNIRVQTRLTEAEHKAFSCRLEKSGFPIEKHIRQLLLTGEVKVLPDEAERLKKMAAIAKEVNAIGTNINQVAHAANISRQAPESRIDFLLKKLDEVIAALNRIQEE